MSPKIWESETFGTDVMFCSAHCGVSIQPRSDLKLESYSREYSLSGGLKSLHDLVKTVKMVSVADTAFNHHEYWDNSPQIE